MTKVSGKDWVKNVFLDTWRPYLWIAAVAFIVYLQAITFGFTHLDDKQLILDNYGFISNLSNVPQVFFQKTFLNSAIPYYRPLLIMTFMVDTFLGGPAPAIYHLTNIFIHILASSLVYLFLTVLKYRKEAALVSSLVFAVHPALAQAVAWVPGRNDSLLAVFSILTFISLAGYLKNGKFLYYLSHIIFFGLALFTKESAVVMIPLGVIYIYLVNERRPPKQNVVILCAGWFIVAVFWFLIRHAALAGSMPTTLRGMTMALVQSMPALVQFIGKIVLPFNLSVFPTIRDTGFIYGTLAILAVALALILSRGIRRQFLLFGLSWFVFFLCFSFIRPTHKCVLDFQEHRLYVPMIGFIIMLMEIDCIKNLDIRKMKTLVISAALIAGLSLLTVLHIQNFKDSVSFWRNASRTSPRSSFVHLSVGFIYYLEGLIDEAEREYKTAIAIEPETPLAHIKLGLLYMDKGMMKEAEYEFKKEIEVCPYVDHAYLSLGVLYYKQGKPKEAEELWMKTLKINPHNTDAMKNLAIFYYEKRDLPKAVYYVGQLRKRGFEPPQGFLKALGIE